MKINQINIRNVSTPSNLVLLQKLVVPQQAKKIPVLHCLLTYQARWGMTIFATASNRHMLHLTLPHL
jgi:hypothetical protein